MSDGPVRAGAPGPVGPADQPEEAGSDEPPDLVSGRVLPAEAGPDKPLDLVSGRVLPGEAGPEDPPGPAKPGRPPDVMPTRAANPPYPADLSYWFDLRRWPGLHRPDPPDPPADGYPSLAEPPSWSGGLAGTRLLVLALLIAVASALIGGMIGGYIGARPAGGMQPSYSLGTVPPALTNRPPDSVAGIAARVLPSVVMIKVNGDEGTGSGFIIRGGYIVTNDHVVTLDGAVTHATLQVVFNGGQMESARLVGADPYSDIAILRLQQPVRLPALSLGNSGSVDVGDPVIAFGSPLGLANTVTSGIISALNRPVQPGTGGSGSTPQAFYDAIQTDAPINPGNSGGPLVNAQAQVIGVNAAIDTLSGNPLNGVQGGSIGLGFAIPINHARIVATELIRTGRAAHSVIGALVNNNYAGNGAQIASSRPGAAPSVSPGGPAALAGLQPGDVIIRFAGQPIDSATTLLDAIRSQQPGTRVTVTFIRNGGTHTVTLVLGSAQLLRPAARGRRGPQPGLRPAYSSRQLGWSIGSYGGTGFMTGAPTV
jgi:S1-C subfamily serine protease